MIRRPIALGILLLTAAAPLCRADLKILDYSSAANDRFNGSSQFIASGLNFSGVGKAVGTEAAFISNNTTQTGGSNGAQFAVLISPSFALVAFHDYQPGEVPPQLTFVAGNGTSLTGSVTVGVAGVQDIGGSDLALVRLSTPVNTSVVQPYAIAADNMTALTGAPIFVYGQSNRVGENNIDATTDFRGFHDYTVPGSNPGVGFTYTYNPNSTNPNEAMLQSGDSSGPSFVEVNGQLVLVGIHWAAGGADPSDPNQNPLSLDTYVPFYASAIQAQITADGSSDKISIVAYGVPEPASMALLGLGAIGAATLSLRHGRSAPRRSSRPID